MKAPNPRLLPADHRHLKTSIASHIGNANPLVILSTPVIYLCLFPFLLLDLAVSLYQAVCFPIYGIDKVRRQDYLIFDRGRLAYLNGIEKVGCIYCSYANGLLAYIAEIAARTELRFCPIQHDTPVAKPHDLYAQFVPYRDAAGYRTVARARRPLRK